MESDTVRISENISENTPRGRPSLFFSEQWRRQFAALYRETTTSRGLGNKFYEVRSMSLLGFGADSRYQWLANSTTQRYRKTILQELGRIADEETLLVTAGQLCELKPTTSTAVAGIRRVRGVHGKPTSEGLRERLLATINTWLKEFPSGTWEQVLAAVEVFGLDVKRGAVNTKPAD